MRCFHANHAVLVMEGKIFTCTVAPNAHIFSERFGIDLALTERDYLDIHKAESKQDILEFLATPKPFCRYCDVAARSYGHPWERSKQEMSEWLVSIEETESGKVTRGIVVPVSFGMIVLNGEPFLRYNYRALYPFAQQIIVVEGAAPAAASIATADGHSTDGTLEVLRRLKAEEDPEDKLLIVTAEDEGYPNGFWPGEKHEQSRAYARRATGDYLWQVDVDEFYQPAAMTRVLDMVALTLTSVACPSRYFGSGAGWTTSRRDSIAARSVFAGSSVGVRVTHTQHIVRRRFSTKTTAICTNSTGSTVRPSRGRTSSCFTTSYSSLSRSGRNVRIAPPWIGIVSTGWTSGLATASSA